MARSKYKVANMDQLPQDPMDTLYADLPPETATQDATAEQEAAEPVSGKRSGQTGRSKRYAQALTKINREQLYALEEAIEILKGLPQPSFDQSLEAHLQFKDAIGSVEVTYPHTTGKTVRVEIFSDDLLASLDKQEIAFDVLLATPSQMSKLTKYARLLGPKGLMPNPKNGTLIQDPLKRKTELESGTISVRGEKKAPLLHTTIGKISMSTDQLAANMRSLLTACNNKTLKLTIATSMSPGIKIQL